MKFVDEIAQFILESGQPSENFVVVLPSDRMRKYLQVAIGKKFGRPVLSPEILTIDRFMKQHIPYTVIDRTALLLSLYQVHKEHEKDPIKASFEEFMTWGELLLNDFNDIDRYMVEPERIFRNLQDVKEIEQWSFSNETLSQSQQRFLEFWDTLPIYYSALNKKLENSKLCYGGKGFRMLAENVDWCFYSNKECRFIFAGFNAFSVAEKSIIKQLQRMGRAELFVDADRFYLDQPHHEAGSFIREYISEIKSTNEIKNVLLSKEMQIDIFACTQYTGQVKVVANELTKLGPNDLKETLLLLADEGLITALVKNLPKTIGKANISMGIPLRSTSIRTLVDSIFSIQGNFERFKTNAFYHQDILRLMKHPFIQSIVSKEEQERLTRFEGDLIRKNRVFLNRTSLENGLEKQDILFQTLDIIATPWEKNWSSALNAMKILSRLFFSKMEKDNAFERAILEAFYTSIVAFEQVDLSSVDEITLRSFRQLFEKQWTSEAIAYHGNPIDGLQITGLLESRGLDFKRVICVGLNEGKLPPTNPIQTLIPMDLRRFYKLPLVRDKQGIFAHHFYRLLHNCEHMLITFSQTDTPMGLHEPSRYVMQLEKELSRQNDRIRINRSLYSLENESAPKPLRIEKNAEVHRRLDQLIEKSVSASMLRTYLTCSLDFYYKYVLDFGEAQNVEEEIENATFGTLIHETLEELYNPYARFYYEDLKRKKDGLKERTPLPMTSLVFDQLIEEYPLVLERKFAEFFNDTKSYKSGHNYLAFKVAKDLTKRFLKNEREFVMRLSEPMTIEYLEFKMEHEMELEVDGSKKRVKFIGYADRIDKVGDKFRIIDYKSGKVSDTDVKFMSRGEDLLSKSIRNRKFLIQLTQYIWMFKQIFGHNAEAGIYSFLDTNSTLHQLDFGKFDRDEVIESFPDEIASILSEIYDSEMYFEHDAGFYSYCNYCN